jgi:hypothetical protein
MWGLLRSPTRSRTHRWWHAAPDLLVAAAAVQQQLLRCACMQTRALYPASSTRWSCVRWQFACCACKWRYNACDNQVAGGGALPGYGSNAAALHAVTEIMANSVPHVQYSALNLQMGRALGGDIHRQLSPLASKRKSPLVGCGTARLTARRLYIPRSLQAHLQRRSTAHGMHAHNLTVRVDSCMRVKSRSHDASASKQAPSCMLPLCAVFYARTVSDWGVTFARCCHSLSRDQQGCMAQHLTWFIPHPQLASPTATVRQRRWLPIMYVTGLAPG